MYVAVTRTKQGFLRSAVEVATIAGRGDALWLRQIDGFDGLLMLSNEDEATTLVLNVLEADREAAERHRVARMRFRDRVTAAVDVDGRGDRRLRSELCRPVRCSPDWR